MLVSKNAFFISDLVEGGELVAVELAECLGRHPGELLELCREVSRGTVAQRVGDFAD